MDLTDLTIFSMMSKRMTWLAKRQQVLAQNIANSDTPKYRPSDLKGQNFGSFLRPTMPRQAMRTTSSGHIEAPRRPPRFRAEKSTDTYETTPSGNAVVIEEQLMKVAETQGGYRLATNLYRKHLKMLKSAIGGQGR